MHAWGVRVSTPAGLPVSQARTSPSMAACRSTATGCPPARGSVRRADEGAYLLEGMKFSMTGWWEIKLAIQTPDGADKVTFNTVVANPSTAR